MESQKFTKAESCLLRLGNSWFCYLQMYSATNTLLSCCFTLNYWPLPGNSIRGRGINLPTLAEVSNTLHCSRSSS